MAATNDNTDTFTSQGFDLDALAGPGATEDVVFELGGTATTTELPKEVAAATSTTGEEDSPMTQAEQFKAQGNEAFKQQNYLEACDMYTAAIEASPGFISGSELLALQDEFDREENKKLLEQNRLEAESRRKAMEKKHEEATDDNKTTATTPEKPNQLTAAIFTAPSNPHSPQIAVYYCNRAACKLYLEQYEESLEDCDIAALWNPTYVKAYVRRSAAHEKLDHPEAALRDVKTALELDPKNAAVKKTVARLQKLEDARMEQLKEETMGKLKDLGNSLLGNFGLSLDNFQAKQDPSTGSYSVSFDQGK